MKKLLFIAILFLSQTLFAQQEDKNDTVVKKEVTEKTIKIISAYPNPFISRTRINFSSTRDQELEFTVKNLLGKTVFLEKINARRGVNYFNFERNNLQQGMYIYSLKSKNEIVSKRLVIR